MLPTHNTCRTRVNYEAKPTAIDIFCGCGGLTSGLKRAGFQVLAAVDIDPFPLNTYRANHKDTIVLQDDIKNIDPAKLIDDFKLQHGELDLLAGCPPCQGFSTMRTLNGAVSSSDPRNDLLFEFLRFIEVMSPRAVMLENVPGLALDRRFKIFCRSMQKLGYVGEHKILDAADYGVPQRRRRLIYLAGKGMAIPFAEKSSKTKTVRMTIARLPKAGESGDPVHDIPEKRTAKVMELIRLIPKNGGSRNQLPVEFHLECHKRCSGFKDVYGRMAWDSVSPTITGGCFNPSKGRFLHPEEDRAITMREAAMLQGFPKNYKIIGTDNKSGIALMIGNALPPPFIEAHGRSIKHILRAMQQSECD